MNAHNPLQAWAYLIECNLATLEELEMLKSSSAARIRRQKSICDRAVAEFRSYGDRDVAAHMRCGRLLERL